MTPRLVFRPEAEAELFDAQASYEGEGLGLGANVRSSVVLGMVLFGLDGCIFLLAYDWIGVGFHAFALAMIAKGYVAARRLPSPNA